MSALLVGREPVAVPVGPPLIGSGPATLHVIRISAYEANNGDVATRSSARSCSPSR
jgi:hypothetical protein